MAFIGLKNSVMGVIAETEEGTYLPPASDTDYVALQPDAAIVPETETLENVELTGTNALSKPIQGLETPTATFSSYLKHSGTEGVAPETGPILKALFGTEDVASTEYDTVAGSTTSVIKVDTGEGVNFQRGQSLLIKDGTNGYSIRPVHSVSGDDLTLGFYTSEATPTSTNLGKAITYIPADSDHDTLSLSYYLGNSGAVLALSGARPVSYSITADAGQLVNGAYNFEGLEYLMNPITLASTDIYLDFTDDGGTFAAVVEAKSWKDPKELAEALTTSMNSVQTAETHLVEYNSKGTDAGKFTISTSTSTVFSLLWNTGTNTANSVGDKIGFSLAADDTGATSYTSDSVLSWAAPHTPVYDGEDPLSAKYQEVMLSDDGSDIDCIEPSTIAFNPTNTKTNINSICSESGVLASLITSRQSPITLTAILPQHCVDNFARYRKNQTVRFQYSFGTKTGGNWDAGKCGCWYSPSCVISSITIENEDDIARMQIELTPFSDSGLGELFLSFV
jgi:hypothetical protein